MATPSARGSSSSPRKFLGKALRRTKRLLDRGQSKPLSTPKPKPSVKRPSASTDDPSFTNLLQDKPSDKELVRAARRMIKTGSIDQARSLAYLLRSKPEHAAVGDIVAGLVAAQDHLPSMTWELLAGGDRAQVLRLAPAEYFRAGFTVDPAVAGNALTEGLRDETINATAAQWFDIASTSFQAEFETESREALARGRASAEAAGNDRLVTRIEWLEDWYGTAEKAKQEISVPAGTIPFAILDYKQPDEAFASKNLGDHVQTIASMGHLVRRSGFRFSGEADAVRSAHMLQKRIKPERVIDGDDAEITLYRVQRDATNHDLVPDGTWMLAFGWYMHRMFGGKFDMPFNPRLRPIFVSFHVNAPALLTDGVIDYLKKYAPIGCRDWNTVHLLQAAGVPAFFSGCLTTTVDTVFPAVPGAKPSGTFYVDTAPTGPGVAWRQTDPEVRRTDFADNVDDAMKVLTSYQVQYENVVTSRLHCYLPARSLGAKVEFRAKNPSDVRFDGLVNITDEAYENIRSGMLALLEPVIGAIGAGKSEDEVYALWRELTAPKVAEAEALRHSVDDIGEVSFDIAAACRAIQERSVTIERTENAPAGDPVAVELALGGDLKHQLDVVLESIVANASRPIHAYVLTRGHDESDFKRVASAFPTVTFTWLPTDDVDYGTALNESPRISTLDEMLLPELLRDVPKIVHLDIRSVVVGDIAELSQTDLAGSPLAARTAPDIDSGFMHAINASKRMKDENPLARELILRSHTLHSYDFLAFDTSVAVLDLDRMRSDEFCRHFLPWVERYKLNVQEVLNAYAGSDRAHLDPPWNRLPHVEVVHDAKIISWTGSHTPWDPDYVQCQDVWDTYAERV